MSRKKTQPKQNQINFSENDEEEKKTFAQAREQVVKTVLQRGLEDIKHCKFSMAQKTNSTAECRSIACTIKQSFSSI